MNVYIVIDMECVSGVVNERMVRVGSSEWAERGRKLMTAEANAAIEGAIEGGAKRIWVQDGHDSGENLISEELHPSAELISGAQLVPHHIPRLDDSFDTMFLMGFHARMGTLSASMDHTVTTASISEIRLNGTAVGEIGIYAAFAGHLGVPVSLVTGDVAATREACDLLGDISTVAVMEGYGRFSVRVRSPEVTRAEIRKAAELAVSSTGSKWTPEPPVRVEVDFLRTAEADMAGMVPGAVRTSGRTVEYCNEDPEMAFTALKAMVSLSGIAAHKWARTIYTTGSQIS